MVQITQKDTTEWLRTLPDSSINLIITDPPYESLEKYRRQGTTTRLSRSKASSNAWFPIFPNSRFPELFAQLHRVLRNNSHFYFFCDAETMFVAKPLAESAGFLFWKPLVWDKQVIGLGYHYRARYELILFFEKGKRNLKDLSVPDILEFKRIKNGYPGEKPVELIKVLINQSSVEGELVCDPFCGSGSTGVAAVRLKRKFTGCDISDRAIRLSEERIRCAH